jgi:hypothetical protein
MEARPSYVGTKNDYYTHVMDIPPQYGDGHSDSGKEVEQAQLVIGGRASWRLPLNLSADDLAGGSLRTSTRPRSTVNLANLLSMLCASARAFNLKVSRDIRSIA